MEGFTTIKLSKEIVNKYKILAAKLNVPRKNLIDTALQEFLEKAEGEENCSK